MLRGDVKVRHHEETEREEHCGRAGEHDQADVNAAMEALARAAPLARDEVVLVIGAHIGRNAGNIVAPAGENAAYNGIVTFTASLHAINVTARLARAPASATRAVAGCSSG